MVLNVLFRDSKSVFDFWQLYMQITTHQHWLLRNVAPKVIRADKQTHQLVNWQILTRPAFEDWHKWDPWSVAHYLTRASASEDVGGSRRPKGYWTTQWREDLKSKVIVMLV